MMMTATKIVVDVELDDETLSEIEMLRTMRLKHYEKMVQNPEEALETLKRAGLKEESTPAQVAANAYAKVSELRNRLSNRQMVYEDELSLYVESLDATEYQSTDESTDESTDGSTHD